MKIVYKLPIRTGRSTSARTDTITSSGSVDAASIARDFTREQRHDFVIRREILWESETASDAAVYAKEIELIRAHRANDPAVGDNRWPNLRR